MSSREEETISDLQLFIQLQSASDEESARALHGLIERYYPRLRAYLRLRVESDDAIDDILQDVFIRLWRHRRHVTRPDSVARYLYTAARNAAFDAFASEQSRRRREQVSAFDEGSGDDPSLAVESNEMDERIQLAVEALPPRCKEIFLLARVHGLAYPEVAAVLGVSLSTVKTQMGRAMTALATALGPLLGIVLAIRR